MIDALFLNSPFFEFNADWMKRKLLMPILQGLAEANPRLVVVKKVTPLYFQSLHRSHRGAWDYRLDWKPMEGFPVSAGWMRALHNGHNRLHAGLDVRCPVLLMCSSASSNPDSWDDVLMSTDAVLDVQHICRHADDIGPHVTRIRIEGGMHDLMLSAPRVREKVLAELWTWSRAYF
jgi:alpha-beta hydrolase superfamily lysophospholipase